MNLCAKVTNVKYIISINFEQCLKKMIKAMEIPVNNGNDCVELKILYMYIANKI